VDADELLEEETPVHDGILLVKRLSQDHHGKREPTRALREKVLFFLIAKHCEPIFFKNSKLSL